ncbi:MAG: oligosaccharide flippase family protein [Candidatus Nealsonbacteria bacterium]
MNNLIQSLKKKAYDLLRKAQKYTKTDNVYLAKGGTWLAISQIGVMVVSLAMGVVWARFVPKEVYGQYKFILSLAGILAIFSLGGMKAVTTQAVAKGFEGTIKPILKTRFRWSTLALLGGFILAIYYWINGNQVLAISFLIAGALTPIINNFSIYGDYISGKKRFDLQAKYSLIRTVLDSLSIIIAIFLTKNVIYLILVYFATGSILHIFFYFFTLKKLPPNQNIDPGAVKHGKHLSVVSVIGKIGDQLDKILIFHYLGAVELAVYSFAVALPNFLTTPTTIIKEMALPKFSARNEKDIKKTAWSKIVRFGLFLLVSTALYIIFAELIFKLFFPTYMESVLYSRIYAISLIGGITFLPRLVFVAKSKTKILYKYTTSMQITRILILFVSVYFFGLIGIMVGHVIYSFISILIAFLFFRSYSKT